VTSGARLELSWNVFDDGSRQLDTVEVFDAERNEMCVPRAWADGETYCTPGGRQLPMVTTVYTSAACDVSMVRSAEALTYIPMTDGAVITALHRAESVGLDAYWMRDADGVCAGPFAAGEQRFYARGVEVPRTALTRVESREIDGGARVRVTAHVSDDGLALPHGMRDATFGFDCILRTTDAGVTTCLPPRQASLRFSDAGCSAPVVGQHASYGDVSPYVFAGEVCAPQGFMVSIEVPSAPGYEIVDGACVATPAPVGFRWFQAAPIDLATVERRHVATPGARLEAIELSAGDLTLDEGNRFDTRTGGECHIASSTAEPGVRRCLPQDPGHEYLYFSDATCAQPVPLANVYRQAPLAKCGASLPPFAVAADRPGTYYRIMSSQTAPVYRIDETGRCTASPMEGIAGTPLLFQMGEPVPVTEFVAAHVER
jgi:hypothetical protein